MKLSKLGERRIIDIITKNLNICGKVIVDIGDDACILDVGGDRYLVISTDLITKKAHIPKEMTPRQIGMYIVNVNLSDIAAMGAKPLGMVFSLGLPGDFDEVFIKGLSQGMQEACEEHGTCILGGDTKEHSEIIISGTALGMVNKNNFLTRSGAKVGDLICVTGNIGLAAAGFYALTRRLNIERKIMDKITRAALEPRARVREGILLAKYANACMDISDGLAFSLHEISKSSGVGFTVYEDKVQIDENIRAVAESACIPSREIIFHKGGDYELLFTLAPERFEELEKEINKIGTKISIIGEITKKGKKIINIEGGAEDLESRGFESFITKF